MKRLSIAVLFILASCSKQSPADVQIADAWARATAAGQSGGAVYLTIANSGGYADRLLSAATDRAGMARIHEVSNDNGISRMRMVDGLNIPPGSSTELKPGGTHIMLEGISRPLTADERFKLVLRFENSGEKTATVNVVEAGAR